MPGEEPRLHSSYLKLAEVEALFGHENLGTTQIYTHATIQRLREAHDKTHPGAKDPQPPEKDGQQ